MKSCQSFVFSCLCFAYLWGKPHLSSFKTTTNADISDWVLLWYAHRGLSPATCEKIYIDTARYLDTYGVHMFPATWVSSVYCFTANCVTCNHCKAEDTESIKFASVVIEETQPIYVVIFCHKLKWYCISVCWKQDHSNEDVQLGVTSHGLAVFQNHVKTNTFIWYGIMLHCVTSDVSIVIDYLFPTF